LQIDVVILTWNDGALLDVALSSALCSEGVEVSVYVVDNGSVPQVELNGEDRVSLFRSDENRGVAAGRNTGASMGTAPLVCFLDSDAKLGPGCLYRLASCLLDQPGAAMAAPVFSGQRAVASGGKAPGFSRKACRALGLTSSYKATSGQTHPNSNGVSEVDFSIGACQLFRRSVFDEVGGLDGSIFYGPEDLDFCMKIRQHGWQIIQVAGAVCDHPPRRRHRKLLRRQTYVHGMSVLKHLWKYRKPAAQ
jgi:N-acetylglucosaminyl-diphospho-decaprenol L-rhamnosyltransferase